MGRWSRCGSSLWANFLGVAMIRVTLPYRPVLVAVRRLCAALAAAARDGATRWHEPDMVEARWHELHARHLARRAGFGATWVGTVNAAVEHLHRCVKLAP